VGLATISMSLSCSGCPLALSGGPLAAPATPPSCRRGLWAPAALAPAAALARALAAWLRLWLRRRLRLVGLVAALLRLWLGLRAAGIAGIVAAGLLLRAATVGGGGGASRRGERRDGGRRDGERGGERRDGGRRGGERERRLEEWCACWNVHVPLLHPRGESKNLHTLAVGCRPCRGATCCWGCCWACCSWYWRSLASVAVSSIFISKFFN
jgi:hypothetical protein